MKTFTDWFNKICNDFETLHNIEVSKEQRLIISDKIRVNFTLKNRELAEKKIFFGEHWRFKKVKMLEISDFFLNSDERKTFLNDFIHIFDHLELLRLAIKRNVEETKMEIDKNNYINKDEQIKIEKDKMIKSCLDLLSKLQEKDREISNLNYIIKEFKRKEDKLMKEITEIKLKYNLNV